MVGEELRPLRELRESREPPPSEENLLAGEKPLRRPPRNFEERGSLEAKAN
jgi:hypothetical protein